MRVIAVVVAALGLALVGCSASNTSSSPPTPTPNTTIYYDYFASSLTPQVAVVSYPLTASSVPTLINGNGTNNLVESNSLLFDSSSRLWVFTQTAPANNFVQVFALPFSQTSAPLFTLTLSGTLNVIAAAFDVSGNLWVASENNTSVIEYSGPFTATATLVPNITITNGLNRPTAIAFDGAGDLFVTNFGSAGTSSVTRFNAPLTNGMSASAQLNGITEPAGIAFDKAGDLYVGSTGTVSAPGPIYRYNSGNEGNGAVPDITDSTGILNNSYASTLVFDSVGNLYDGDCGNPAKIYVFPTATSPFSATLAPSVVYGSADVTTANCVWGLAIR